jgi:hypothetical protein
MTETTATIAIIPCGGEKLAASAPARELYTGAMFTQTLSSIEASGDFDRIIILSALHGLVELDAELAPYDLRMGDEGSVGIEVIRGQAEELGILDDEIFAFLPASYFEVLDAALRLEDVFATPVYEAAAGIGFQRGVNAHVGRAELSA